jgi:hypothetical protein
MPRSTARSSNTEELDVTDHDAPLASAPLVSVDQTTPRSIRDDTRAVISQSAAYNVKSPMPGQRTPTPLPSASTSLPMSPNHPSRTVDVTTTVAEYSAPSPPQLSTPPRQHTRRFTPVDPYSRLTSLQRDILLCIQTAAEEQNSSPSLYPISAHNPSWEGVHVRDIVRSVSIRRPGLVPNLSEFESVTFWFVMLL